MILNMTGSGGSGGNLTVTTPGAGVTVTVSKDGKTKTKVSGADGTVVFKGLEGGTWTVTITNGSQTAQKTVAVTTDYNIVVSFNAIPEFTYTGNYEIVNDADEPITTSQDNWKIRFLTSGTLTFTALNGAGNGIDVFLVGGGGSGGFSGGIDGGNTAGNGGGSGYAITHKNAFVKENEPITVTIGAGGAYPTANRKGNDGGETSFGGMKAAGGIGGGKQNAGGGDGGSGGNGLWADERKPDKRGSDGSDGFNTDSSNNPGKGQKNKPGPNGETGSTREFGDPSGKLYAYGGFAAGPGKATPKDPNTGDGGDAGANIVTNNGAGGSGIVIIRNARGVS